MRIRLQRVGSESFPPYVILIVAFPRSSAWVGTIWRQVAVKYIIPDLLKAWPTTINYAATRCISYKGSKNNPSDLAQKTTQCTLLSQLRLIFVIDAMAAGAYGLSCIFFILKGVKTNAPSSSTSETTDPLLERHQKSAVKSTSKEDRKMSRA